MTDDAFAAMTDVELRAYVRDGVLRARQAAAKVGTQHTGWDVASDGEALLAGRPAIAFRGPTALRDFARYVARAYPPSA